VLAGALTQAREARLHILDVMAEAIDAPDEMSEFAPRIITVKVPVDKIGEVIGPKGKMINQIQDDTGADISIEDDGTVWGGRRCAFCSGWRRCHSCCGPWSCWRSATTKRP
jgi:polyribonucleotide nucleotidyltransferase